MNTGAGGLNLFSGLVQGFARGQSRKREDEREKQEADLKKQLMQAQIAAEKTKQKEADFRQQLIQAFLGEQEQKSSLESQGVKESLGQPTETKLGSSFSGDLAKQSLANINPILADIMGLGGAQSRSETRRYHDVMAQQGQGRLDQGEERLDISRENLNLAKNKVVFGEFEKGGERFRQTFNEQTKQPVGPPVSISGKKAMPAETAGKMGMLESGLDALKRAKSILMPEGRVTRQTYEIIGQMQTNMPWTAGREARSLIDDALEGKIRIESGAAVPDPEVKRAAIRFRPSVFDTPQLIRLKLDRLERYLSGTVEKLDPNKNYRNTDIIMTGEDGNKYVLSPGEARLTKDKAMMFLELAGGDKEKARKLARDEGYSF